MFPHRLRLQARPAHRVRPLDLRRRPDLRRALLRPSHRRRRCHPVFLLHATEWPSLRRRNSRVQFAEDSGWREAKRSRVVQTRAELSI